MDKAEYKLKLEEINALAEKGDFRAAAKVCDEVDWKHVKGARTLCMVGEIYEADKRYTESLNLLKMAYKYAPQSKTVLYRLAELNIRMREFDDAKRYKREFEEVAPKDYSSYILQYKLLRANKAPIDDQIQVLLDYKDREYTERWSYELAKLYLKNGQIEKCIEECDDMILWFSEGKYVRRAMELKMQIRPLTAVQKAKYDAIQNGKVKDETAEINLTAQDAADKAVKEAAESETAVDMLDASTRDLGLMKENLGDTKQFVMGGSGSEKLQEKLAGSIQALFTGMHPGKEAETGVKEENKKEENTVKPLEAESSDPGQVVVSDMDLPSVAVEEPKEEDELDRIMAQESDISDISENGQIDLDKLFAETGSALAGEVASGAYVLSDTIEDKPEVLESDSLTARESDESLGLTREFHFSEELAKEMAQRAKDKPKTAIPNPEDAAKAAVLKATGKNDEEEEFRIDEIASIPEEEEVLPEAEELGINEEDLFKSFGSDEAIQKELLADESEVRKIPEDAGEEALMNLSSVAPKAVEDSKSIIEHIMEEPEVFTRVPVEARALTDEEKKSMSYFASIPGVDYQITTALADIHNNCGDKTSRSGNIVIMGRMGSGKTRLAEGLVLATCQHLNLKAAKFATIVAEDFNTKDPAAVVKKMSGGFLLIEAAGALSDEAIEKLNQAMEFRTDDLIVILEDEKADMRKMLSQHPEFAEKFSSTITVPVFTNDELVTFSKTYAKENGYKLDELATLALYTMIGDHQKDSEPVTVGAAKEMIDRAIERHKKKFLFGKNEKSADGRIVLKEKDFNF